MSAGRRAALLQLASLVALLALGLGIGLTIVWALIAVPMTAVVLLALVELETTRVRSRSRAQAPTAPRTAVPSAHRPPDTPLVTLRRGSAAPDAAHGPIRLRRSRLPR